MTSLEYKELFRGSINTGNYLPVLYLHQWHESNGGHILCGIPQIKAKLCHILTEEEEGGRDWREERKRPWEKEGKRMGKRR